MDVSTWLQAIASGVAILGAIGFVGRWVIKKYLSELKPNHGTSLNDAIKLQVIPLIIDLSLDMKEVKSDIKELNKAHNILEGRFEQHVEEE